MAVHYLSKNVDGSNSIQPASMNRGGSTGPRRVKITTQYGNTYYMTPENAPKQNPLQETAVSNGPQR